MTDEPRVTRVTRVQVAAARLRITCDRRLGRETPETIVKIANAKPEPK